MTDVAVISRTRTQMKCKCSELMCVSCSWTHSMVFWHLDHSDVCANSHIHAHSQFPHSASVWGVCVGNVQHVSGHKADESLTALFALVFILSCVCLCISCIICIFFCSRKSPTGQNKWILNQSPPPRPNWFQSHHRKLELPVKSLINNCYVRLFSNHTWDKRCQFLIIFLLSASSLLLILCSPVWKAFLSFNNVTTWV